MTKTNEAAQAERDSMEFDVVIVGAGPAGLSAAIRLKSANPDLAVVVLEKGAEIGAHIVSGAVIDPVGLDALFKGWRDDENCPVKTKVSEDVFLFLREQVGVAFPNILMPKMLNNHGNYVVSLGNVCRWLGQVAEGLGVDIYAGFAASELVFDEHGAVKGVATGDTGLAEDGSPGPGFMRGMELHGKYVLLAEGVRGSLSKVAIERFGLDAESDPAKFGIGIKEIWEVPPENHRPGYVQHTFGWPLKDNTGGGSFMYHYGENLVSMGFVVHLNYANPYLSPYEEFQRVKHHPKVACMLKGGKRISYGARAITEGGWQSVPKLVFPGGALVGCSAGFVNLPRIKGSHNAILSGILVADELSKALAEGRNRDELTSYEDRWRDSDIGKDLKPVRNFKPFWSKFGTIIGFSLGWLDLWINQISDGWSPFGTIKHNKSDHESTEPANRHKPIDYPKPDGELSFDRTSSVFLSNTNHRENQPIHLRVLDLGKQVNSEFLNFAGPSSRYCPAGVYEWLDEKNDPVEFGEPLKTEGARFQINSQNCVHCKTCDIKDPNQNINWTPPEGGGGPIYTEM